MKNLNLLLLITVLVMSSISFAQKDGSEYTLAELEQLRTSAIASDNNALIDLCDKALIKKFKLLGIVRKGALFHHLVIIKQLDRMFEVYYELNGADSKKQIGKLTESILKEDGMEDPIEVDPIANKHKKIDDYTIKELGLLRSEAIKNNDDELIALYYNAIITKYHIRRYERKEKTKVVSHFKGSMNNRFEEHYIEEEEEALKEKLKEEAKNRRDSIESIQKSKLSFGIMPLFMLDVYNPDYGSFYGPLPGLGMEIHINHSITTKINFSGFMRYSFLNNGITNAFHGGSAQYGIEKPKDHFVALGCILEYKVFKRWGLQARMGAELLNNYTSREFNGLYGFGINYQVRPSAPPGANQSVNLTVYHSNNQTKYTYNPSTYESVTYFQDTYIIQLGWKFQFHSKID